MLKVHSVDGGNDDENDNENDEVNMVNVMITVRDRDYDVEGDLGQGRDHAIPRVWPEFAT